MVLEALEADLVLHAEHPDFGGTITAGRYFRAVGAPTWALIHHAPQSWDATDEEIDSVPALARAFVFQVGRRAAIGAARRALGGLT